MKKIIGIFVILFVCTISINVCYGANEDNLLQSLKINQEGLSPEFSPEKYNYSLFLKDSINSIDVDAVANGDAKVEIIGNKNLKLGDNEVVITVTPKKGEKKEYKIIVTKTSNVEASDSYLQNLILENIELKPSFSPEVLEYDGGTVPNKINNILTFASARQEGATVKITGNEDLQEGENIISVNVTSVDGSTNKEYKIKVVKEKVEETKSNAVDSKSDADIDKNESIKKDSKMNYKILLGIIVILIVICVIVAVVIKKNKK